MLKMGLALRHMCCLVCVVTMLYHAQAQNTENVVQEMKTVCYYPNWAQHRLGPGRFVVRSLNPDMCTHIIFAYPSLHGQTYRVQDKEENDQDQLRELVRLKESHPELKILFALGGWPGDATTLSRVATSMYHRERFINGVMEFLEDNELDGLVLHWTYPTSEDRDHLTELVKDLHAAFHDEEEGTNYLLGLDVGVNSFLLENYDLEYMQEHVDWFGLMTYDMAGGWNLRTGHHAPLYGSSQDDTTSMDWAVSEVLRRGVSSNKVLLGLSTYGRSFTLLSLQRDLGLGAPATMGEVGIFSQEEGLLAYYEVCFMVNHRGWQEVFDSDAVASMAFHDDQWVSFDSLSSMVNKCQYTVSRHLGGVVVIDVSTDDFVNYCGHGAYPLLHVIQSIFIHDVENNFPDTLPKPETTQTTILPPTFTTETTTTDEEVPEMKRICYYPSWSQYRPGDGRFTVSNIDPFLCSHLIFAFGAMNKDTFQVENFDWNDGTQIESLVALKIRNPELKIMLAIGGYNAGGAHFSNMAATQDGRSTFISSLVRYLMNHNLDGLDLDWEYPAERDTYTFTALIQDIKAAFTPLGYTLSIGVGVGEQRLKHYDLPALEPHLDWFGLMTYDLAGAWDRKTGYHTAMYPSRAGDTLNLEWVVEEFLGQDISRQKLVLGVATYGRGFTVTNPAGLQGGGVGLAAEAGQEGEFSREKGFLTYYEICKRVESEGWTEGYDNTAECAHAYSGDQWVGYDNIHSMSLKCEYAVEEGLGGVMVWDVSMDDFRGRCSDGANPLLNTMMSVITTGNRRRQLTTRRLTATAFPIDFECPTSGLFEDPTDCSHFINCVDGTAFAYSCPPSMLFNADKGYCDLPQNTVCRNGEEYEELDEDYDDSDEDYEDSGEDESEEEEDSNEDSDED